MNKSAELFSFTTEIGPDFMAKKSNLLSGEVSLCETVLYIVECEIYEIVSS